MDCKQIVQLVVCRLEGEYNFVSYKRKYELIRNTEAGVTGYLEAVTVPVLPNGCSEGEIWSAELGRCIKDKNFGIPRKNKQHVTTCQDGDKFAKGDNLKKTFKLKGDTEMKEPTDEAVSQGCAKSACVTCPVATNKNCKEGEIYSEHSKTCTKKENFDLP